jgi:YNFM family putative membrane transporter
MRAAMTGLFIFLTSCLLMLIDSRAIIFVVMFGFCGGFFLVHTILPGFINRMAEKDKSLVNALYLSFYYFGGTLGSYFPGFIYQRLGWNSYILFLSLIIFIGISFALGVGRKAAHI